MHSLYSESTTWLHGLRAGTKLALLAVLGSLLFIVQSPWWLASAALCCAALWWSLGDATRAARRLMATVAIAALLVALFHLWMGHPALAAVSTLRLLCASTLGIALTVTTRPADLVHVLERLLSPLRWFGLHPERMALQIALMLRFTEHFFAQWQRLADAYRLRTGKAGGLRLIAPLAILMLQASRRVADALWARLGA